MKRTTAWAAAMSVLYLVGGAVCVTALVVDAPLDVLGGVAFLLGIVSFFTGILAFA